MSISHSRLNGKNGRPSPYAGRRVVILGAARQGMASARFLLKAGARVTVSDLRTAEALAPVSAELMAYAVALGKAEMLQFVLGGHPLTLLKGADLLLLSGGVSPATPIVQEAVARGIVLANDGQLTLRHAPMPIIGITGSAGKTTTTTVVGLMLQAAGFTTHVGGNIGTPLLDHLDEVGPGDKLVMELSSFQLELFDRSPAIAGITNVTPNHLDRHPSMEHYAAAKANILRFQTAGDTCVLNADDGCTGPWLRSGRCEITAGIGQEAVYFPLQAACLGFSLAVEVSAGAFLSADRLVWRRPGLADQIVCRKAEVRLRGRHNLANILAACCLAGAAGAQVEAMAAVATSFGGVEHRGEIVRVRDGITWVNDSIATAPERTVAALRSFSEPIVLLVGGRDKHLPWDECATVIRQRARHVVPFGEAAGLIEAALQREAEANQAAVVAHALRRSGRGRGCGRAGVATRGCRAAGTRRHELRRLCRFCGAWTALPGIGGATTMTERTTRRAAAPQRGDRPEQRSTGSWQTWSASAPRIPNDTPRSSPSNSSRKRDYQLGAAIPRAVPGRSPAGAGKKPAPTERSGAPAPTRQATTLGKRVVLAAGEWDYPLVGILVVILALGLVMVFSASIPTWGVRYFVRQVGWIALGVVVMLGFARISYLWLQRLAIPIMIVALAGLTLVLFFGEDILGARRTFFGSIQPSEFAKLAVVVYVAAWVASKGAGLRNASAGLIPFAILMGLITALIVLEPNFSTAW